MSGRCGLLVILLTAACSPQTAQDPITRPLANSGLAELAGLSGPRTLPSAPSNSVAARNTELTLERFSQTPAGGLLLSLTLTNRNTDAHALLNLLPQDVLLQQPNGRAREASWLSPSLSTLQGSSLGPREEAVGWALFSSQVWDPALSADQHILSLQGFEPVNFRPDQLTAHELTRSELDALFASAAPDSFSQPRSRTDPTRDAIEELLDRQARALERLDFTGYLSTIHPSERETERQTLERFRSFSLTDVRLSMISDLPQEPSNQFRGTFQMEYRFQELPEQDLFRDWLEADFIRSDGEWTMKRIEADPSGLLLWRRGQTVLHRAAHFLLYARPGLSRDLDRIAGQAEAAYLKIFQRGLPLAPKYLALVPHQQEFAEITDSPFALGAARAVRLKGEEPRLLNRVFLVNGDLFAGRVRVPEERRSVTIAHELVHLALSQWTQPNTPPWLREGAAVHFSDGHQFGERRRLVKTALDEFSLTGFSRIGSLAHQTQEVGLAYVFAAAVVEHLVKQQGPSQFLTLYGGFGRSDRPADPVVRANELLGELYQTDLERLEAEVKQTLRLQHR